LHPVINWPKLFSAGGGLALCSRLRGKSVHDLARLGIVQLFARFVLNCIAVGLQAVHMVVQPRVFLLKILDLLAEFMVLEALLLPS